MVQAPGCRDQCPGALIRLLQLAVTLAAPPVMGIAARGIHPSPSAWVPPLHCSQPVSASSSTVHRHRPPMFAVELLSQIKPIPSGDCSTELLPTPAPAHRGQLSVAESIPDIHLLGDSHSQTGSDRVQKNLRCSSEASTLPCAVLTGTKITWSKPHVNFLETPSERCHGLAEWQLPGRQVPDLCFLLAHDLEGLAVLLPPRPSPPPAPPAHLIYYGCKSSAASPLSLCLHSTLCSGSYRCCWNINSNTALIINPAGRWTAQA